MDAAIKWGLIGIFTLFLLVGFFVGLIRGIKRSGVHFGFVVLSLVLAFLLTKTITNAILGIKIPINGTRTTISQYIYDMISGKIDISKFKSINDLVTTVPVAIASPFVFLALETITYFFCEIIYLVVARVSFGKKKEDFKKHKPNRLLGALVGTIEGFLLMFMAFAPLTSLTKTASAILSESQSVTASVALPNKLQTIDELVGDKVPANVIKYMNMYNDSVLGKVVSVGGISDRIFDGLSSVKINGEKVYFRSDIVDLARTYDSFTVVYNAVMDKNYNVSTKKFLDNTEKLLDSGIFKSVISETIKDVVLNYDDFKDLLPFGEDETVEELVENMQDTFSKRGFSAYKYLKHDALLVMDVIENVFETNFIQKVDDLDINTASVSKILDFIDVNDGDIRSVFTKLIKMNMVDDNFDFLVGKLSEQVEKNIKQDDTIEVKLNSKVSSKNKIIDNLVTIAKNVNSLNKDLEEDDLSLTKLTEGNIIKNLAKISDIGSILTKIGNTLDTAREMEIFILPVEAGVRDEKVYVVDNILKRYDVELLGNDVYGYNGDDDHTTKLDTYTKFMTYIKTPVDKVQDIEVDLGGGEHIGLLEALTQDLPPIPEIINSLIDDISLDPEIFNKLILPFHEIDKLDLKTKVFDKAINVVNDGTGDLLDFDDVRADDSYAEWKKQFTYMGLAMKYLNAGDIVVSGEHYTCFDYVISGSVDFETLMKELLSNEIEGQSQFSKVLENVFAATVFKPFKEETFEKTDKEIEDVTGQNPNTDISILETDETAISVLENLLDIVINSTDLGFEEVGQVLDALKVNAEANGVFKNVFDDLIWYATGDTMGDFSGVPTNDYYKDVKALINPTSDTTVYYTVNYQQKFAEIDDAVDLANAMKDKVEGISIKDNPQDFMDAISEAFEEYSEEELLDILDDLNTIVEGNADREVVDTSGLTNEEKELAEEKIDETFSPAIAEKLKTLFGLD